ncbi:Adenylate cyclase [Gloeomargarita lithophora Alchichica-D10]|uniref:Adenylate cyclase n=1 Tax=Gloeomargarita lithophora Alchichica-D10 TaxID=1188229 RepID=A0A1J0AB04_9CYAN|nr:adenylate/guanylate cyclase domain-containing protein [Gloeomargarita lithophora]APB33114.1 Adenylate cyclase [Gloeomargarita lithophora Alchichica-D10]
MVHSVISPALPAQLVRLSLEGKPAETFSLVGATSWTVGRSDRAAIVLNNPWISRMHALIQRLEGEEFYVIDLGSRNGSFVNGRRVTVPVQLQHRDEVMFGETRMQFICQEARCGIPMKPELAAEWDRATSAMKVRCLITVLVMDLRDFTPLARQVPEELLAQVVGTWFRQVGDILQRYGSRVDKYIGDAVMAVWLHPQNIPHAYDLLRILKAVLGTEKTTSNLHLQYPLPFPLRMGTGINTGYAMVGNTGSGQRPEYTALGDTVNLAFQLEAATKPLNLDVLLGEATYNYLLTGNLAGWLTPQQMELKYQREPVAIWGSTYPQLKEFLHTYGFAEPPTQNPISDGRGFV